jgi:hypothetical protein
MSKAKVDAPETEAAQVQEQQPAWLQELLDKGTVILTADDREDFGQLIDQIPAEVRYGAGAVAKNHETGIYSLRLDVIK